MDNREIVTRCITFCKLTSSMGDLLPTEAMLMFHALQSQCSNASYIADYLLKAEEAGLEAITGNFIRQLKEMYFVIACMEITDDYTMAKEMVEAYGKDKPDSCYSNSRITQSTKRLQKHFTRYGFPAKWEGLQQLTNTYNHLSHPQAAGFMAATKEAVRAGITFFYSIVNQYAVFVEDHIEAGNQTVAVQEAHRKLDECGRILLPGIKSTN